MGLGPWHLPLIALFLVLLFGWRLRDFMRIYPYYRLPRNVAFLFAAIAMTSALMVAFLVLVLGPKF